MELNLVLKIGVDQTGNLVKGKNRDTKGGLGHRKLPRQCKPRDPSFSRFVTILSRYRQTDDTLQCYCNVQLRTS